MEKIESIFYSREFSDHISPIYTANYLDLFFFFFVKDSEEEIDFRVVWNILNCNFVRVLYAS